MATARSCACAPSCASPRRSRARRSEFAARVPPFDPMKTLRGREPGPRRAEPSRTARATFLHGQRPVRPDHRPGRRADRAAGRRPGPRPRSRRLRIRDTARTDLRWNAERRKRARLCEPLRPACRHGRRARHPRRCRPQHDDGREVGRGRRDGRRAGRERDRGEGRRPARGGARARRRRRAGGRARDRRAVRGPRRLRRRLRDGGPAAEGADGPHRRARRREAEPVRVSLFDAGRRPCRLGRDVGHRRLRRGRGRRATSPTSRAPRKSRTRSSAARNAGPDAALQRALRGGAQESGPARDRSTRWCGSSPTTSTSTGRVGPDDAFEVFFADPNEPGGDGEVAFMSLRLAGEQRRFYRFDDGRRRPDRLSTTRRASRRRSS